MPWLVSEDEDHKADDALLLIHIPRTGGTSLSDDFEVPRRAREGRCCCGFADHCISLLLVPFVAHALCVPEYSAADPL